MQNYDPHVTRAEVALTTVPSQSTNFVIKNSVCILIVELFTGLLCARSVYRGSSLWHTGWSAEAFASKSSGRGVGHSGRSAHWSAPAQATGLCLCHCKLSTWVQHRLQKTSTNVLLYLHIRWIEREVGLARCWGWLWCPFSLIFV